ncbi:TonB-dependent receptor domain-containing protein [Luteimonas sp. R10]|uniref:TonB-dependent receptor domain-containing protein n=1 Tax=Luteimonas sp. R10 TaxID=3108176 RepID=UPI0030917555|nr:TonB-dependent receptor [Luteimonas sp. R10]
MPLPALRRAFLAGSIAAALALCSVTATAQDRTYRFELPAQPLSQALRAYARAAGQQIVFTDDLVAGHSAPELRGSYTAAGALERLLEGSDLTMETNAAGVIMIRRKTNAAKPAGATGFDTTAPDTTDGMTATLSAGGGFPGQDPSSSTAGAADRDTATLAGVVVTGTRIRRDTIDTPTPIVGLSAEELDDTGAQDLNETIAELPFVSQSNSATSSGDNAQSEGLSTVDLRALGDNRTLVLIDGRRTVSNSAQANRVSLSSIPDDFIDRVEIITGGASSVYGSDAIAGVVNIITESDQTGFRVKALGGISEEGDDERREVTASWGTRFDGDRGYFLVSGTHEKRWGIAATDRDFALIEADFDYDTGRGINEFNGIDPEGGPGGDFPANTFPPNLMRDRLTTFFPGGIFDANVSGTDPIGYFDPGDNQFAFLGDDVTAGDVADRFGESDRVFNNILNPRERYLGASKINYRLTDSTEVFAQVQAAREETLSVRRPQSLDDAGDFSFVNPDTGLLEMDNGVGTIDRDDPLVALFAPAQLRTSDGRRGLGDIDWARRFDEVGRTETENERTTVRAWFGARGDAWGDYWRWEATVGYGDFTQHQVRRNEVNLRALEQGLRTEFVPGSTTEIRCRSEEARAEGCVPVNIFGIGSISPEAIDYIRADLRLDANIRQQTFQSIFDGPLFDLPAGPVLAAFGAEYRKDTLRLRNDDLSRNGGTTEITVPDTDGSISAYEGFAEVNIPLLADRPFAENLNLDLSARLANYDIDTVGNVFTYRAGVSWKPIEDIHFRVQYARAERAPDLTELFSPARGDTDSGIVDPCDGVDANTPGAIGSNCRADPGIVAVIEEGGVFETDLGTLLSTNEGNINLESETSDSWTAGVVLTPRFIPGLALSLDYYDITIDNVIELFDNNLLLRSCYESDQPVAQNDFCSRVARDQDDGEITLIRQFETNSDRLSTRGLDFAAQYRFDLESFGVPGQFDLRANATHVLDREITRLGVTTDTRDSLADAPAFKWRALGSLAWRHDDFRLRYSVEYFSTILDSRERLLEYQEVLQEIPDAERPLFLRYPAVWEHSISASYEFDSGSPDLRIFAGVNNIFDKISPFAPDGDVESGRRSNFNGTYDVRGRRYFLGAEFRF